MDYGLFSRAYYLVSYIGKDRMNPISFARWSILRTKNVEEMNEDFKQRPDRAIIINDPKLADELVLMNRALFNKLVTDSMLFKGVESITDATL